jgi:hypothetical protein
MHSIIAVFFFAGNDYCCLELTVAMFAKLTRSVTQQNAVTHVALHLSGYRGGH